MKNGIRITLILLLIGMMTMSACFAQESVEIPVLTIARREIPENEAMQYMKKLGVGWNLGNTFDAINGNTTGVSAGEMALETSWCGVKTSETMFDAIRDAGFRTLRLPVSWHNHVTGDDYQISERWLNRVQQVLDWAVSRDLYVILNIHHDEDQFLPSSAHYEESSRYIQSIWSQLAARFRDYDEHLIFESMNEPRLVGTDYEWYFNKAVPACRDAAKCLNDLNQLFVDTVRATGGNNADRYLMVPGYDASPDGVLNEYFRLPQDPADNRLIVSVHAYTPYSFALQDKGTTAFSVKSQQQTSEIVNFMNSLYNRYIKNGIPVIIGEYGARDKDNLADRVRYAAFYTATASARNIPSVWWDNGAFMGQGELFGVLNRRKAQFTYPEIIDAIMTYAGYEKLPEAK